jgi:hypothetical protein
VRPAQKRSTIVPKKTTITPGKALPVRPMNDMPIDYPLGPVSSVSEDAQLLHRAARRKQKLDRDVFDDTRLHAWVKDDEAEAFQPTERMFAAIAELEAARLATYSPDFKSLYATTVDKQYTVAYGRGSQLIRISRTDEYEHERRLLAVLVGGDIESRDSRNGTSRFDVQARHENATDFEHDASSAAKLELIAVSQPTFAGYGHVKLTALLTKAYLYPIGTDPLTMSDQDTTGGEWCDGKYCGERHPYAPHLPPEVESLGQGTLVTVEALPLRPYEVEDLSPLPLTESEPE